MRMRAAGQETRRWSLSSRRVRAVHAPVTVPCGGQNAHARGGSGDPPLVLKSDSGSPSAAEVFQELLDRWQVFALLSPQRTPRYNGSVEKGPPWPALRHAGRLRRSAIFRSGGGELLRPLTRPYVPKFPRGHSVPKMASLARIQLRGNARPFFWSTTWSQSWTVTDGHGYDYTKIDRYTSTTVNFVAPRSCIVGCHPAE